VYQSEEQTRIKRMENKLFKTAFNNQQQQQSKISYNNPFARGESRSGSRGRGSVFSQQEALQKRL
jgi:hypothetical protein